MSGYWNYRVIKRTYENPIDPGDPLDEYTVCEVYYYEDGSIKGWTEPVPASADTAEDLGKVFDMMLEALDKPILVEAELLKERA